MIEFFTNASVFFTIVCVEWTFVKFYTPFTRQESFLYWLFIQLTCKDALI